MLNHAFWRLHKQLCYQYWLECLQNFTSGTEYLISEAAVVPIVFWVITTALDKLCPLNPGLLFRDCPWPTALLNTYQRHNETFSPYKQGYSLPKSKAGSPACPGTLWYLVLVISLFLDQQTLSEQLSSAPFMTLPWLPSFPADIPVGCQGQKTAAPCLTRQFLIRSTCASNSLSSPP